MKSNSKTTEKRPNKPFTGKEGKKFSKDNQPTPEAKKIGWQQWRKERHLTQGLINELTANNGKNLKEFIQSLIYNSKLGNSKAIDTISRCLEDDIIKVDHTITNTRILSIDPLSDIDATNDSTSQDSIPS